MDLNSLYKMTFNRDVDQNGIIAYNEMFSKKGAWYVYKNLIKSQEYHQLIKSINKNIRNYHVVNNVTQLSKWLPSIITFDTESNFNTICKSLCNTLTLIIHENIIEEIPVNQAFSQSCTVAVLMSGFARFEKQNKYFLHPQNTYDLYGAFWDTVDIHGTNYSNIQNTTQPEIDPTSYKSLSFHPVQCFPIDTMTNTLCKEPHVLQRVKSMYNGIKHVCQQYDGEHELIIKSRTDVQIFDFIDVIDQTLVVHGKHIGIVNDSTCFIPYANYKSDIHIVTDMIAIGSKCVIMLYQHILAYIKKSNLRIDCVPELVLYQYFHSLGIRIIPFYLRYRLLRVTDFQDPPICTVYLGPLYGTCIVENIPKGVRIKNATGQYMGHQGGIITFMHTHNLSDDVFIMNDKRLYTSNLDMIYGLTQYENHMIYLSTSSATQFNTTTGIIKPFVFNRTDMDIIVSRYNESIEWCRPYANMTIIYNKGPALKHNFGCTIKHLENVGRESHTYLTHIINNWNSLNDYTLFLQGGDPGHGQEKPHMFEGIALHDYVCSNAPLFMLISACQDTETMEHFLREGYQGEPEWYGKLINKEHHAKQNKAHIDDLLQTSKYWNNKTDIADVHITAQGVLTYPNDKGASILSFHWCQSFHNKFRTFWLKIFGYPCPKLVYYTQGAQFSVHRDVIKKRSLQWYKDLLKHVEYSVNPDEGYFCELIWKYVFV